MQGQKNSTYIASRFYRAPELILTRDLYGSAIDTYGRMAASWLSLPLAANRQGDTGELQYGNLYESLLDGLLQWRPSSRLSSQQILLHPFFHELTEPASTKEVLPPQLFQYTNEELSVLVTVTAMPMQP